MTESAVLTYSVSGGVALIVIDAPPVNALSHRVRVAIHDGVTRALADDAAKAIVLACAGRTFFAGADVTELNRPIEPPWLADIMAMFEASAKPVIASLHGTALGGGFELALACHYRVAMASAKVGLPEVALGLLPGAGGTQRLPRLIGVAAAVDAIGLGKTIAAPEAKILGLIDEVVEGADPVAAGVGFARWVVERGLPLRRLRDLPVDLGVEEARAVFASFRTGHPDLFVGLKAADGVLRAIEAAVSLPFDEGLQRERAISRELTASPESAAQRHLFFAERAAAKAPGGEKVSASASVRVALTGDGSEVQAWTQLLRGAGIAITEDREGANVVIEVAAPTISNAACHVGFKRTGNLVEIAYREATGAQALADAMAVVRRLGLAGVFVSARDGLVVERLSLKAREAADGLVRTGVDEEKLAAIAPGLLGDARLGAVDDEQARRLLDPVAAEAITLIQEGAVARASDIDFAMVRAGRWPVWLGGPVFWAERQGLGALAARLAERGEHVPPLLIELARAKKSLYG